MKKLIFSTIILVSLSAAAQSKKDSTPPKSYDTLFVLTMQDAKELKEVLLNSKLIDKTGDQMTGKQVLQMIDWINSKVVLAPKAEKREQPKN